MYRRYKFVLLLICLIWMAPINAQLKLSVNAPSVVEANPSYFQIKYTLNLDYAISSEDISDFHFSTDDFTLLSEPGRSFRKEYININGRAKTNCSVTITCTLRPKAKGTFTISPASVHVKGKTYKSKAVKIRVADNAQGNGNRASSSQDDKTEEENAMRTARTGLSQKDLYITADLQKTTVYEQEAVRLKYHVLALPGVGLSNAGLNEKPDFKNIVSLDIPTNPEFTLAHVNGIAYKKYKAKEYVLYPQKAGQIQIPKLTFDCMVMQRDILLDRIDDFLNGGGIGVNVKRSAPQLVLNVKPLPTPKPSGFSGGVGHFKIKSQMRTANLRTNDLATFRITISGTGNLKLITAPDLVFPDGFDSYPPQTVDETTITEDGVSGSISFDYTLVPREVGKFEMPKVDFVFFDPQKGEYQTITAKAFQLNVKKGTKSDAAVEYEKKMRKEDIRGIKLGEAHLVATADYYWWGTWKTYLAFAIVIILGIGIPVAAKRFDIRAVSLPGSPHDKIGRKAIKQMLKLKSTQKPEQPRETYNDLNQILRCYFSERMTMPVNELNTERILNYLKETCHADENLTIKVKRLLNNCEMSSYAPVEMMADAQKDIDDAILIIKTLATL